MTPQRIHIILKSNMVEVNTHSSEKRRAGSAKRHYKNWRSRLSSKMDGTGYQHMGGDNNDDDEEDVQLPGAVWEPQEQQHSSKREWRARSWRRRVHRKMDGDKTSSHQETEKKQRGATRITKHAEQHQHEARHRHVETGDRHAASSNQDSLGNVNRKISAHAQQHRHGARHRHSDTVERDVLGQSSNERVHDNVNSRRKNHHGATRISVHAELHRRQSEHRRREEQPQRGNVQRHRRSGERHVHENVEILPPSLSGNANTVASRSREPQDANPRPSDHKTLAIAVFVDDDEEEKSLAIAEDYDPDAKNPTGFMNPTARCYGIIGVVILVIIALVVGLVVGLTTARAVETPAPTSSPTTILELMYRENFASLVGESVFVSGTPEARAAEWIVNEDTMQLPLDAPSLKQRYTLALLYFSTTDNGNRPWRQCAPSQTKEESCIYVDGGVRYPTERWLSSSSECLWAGVNCTGRETIGELTIGECGLRV